MKDIEFHDNKLPTGQQRLPEYTMDESWIKNFLLTVDIGHFATRSDLQPFITPSTFWYDQNQHAIYFHSNQVGRVRSNIERHSEACFETSNYGEFLPSNTALEFSMQYESVIAFGKISIVEDVEEKMTGLYGLISKYFPSMRPGNDFRPITDKELNQTSLYRLDIECWSGKRNWKRRASQSKSWKPLVEGITRAAGPLIKKEKVIISEYKEYWSQEFVEIASRIRGACGEIALRIDHIGSTAVPGLPAKDRIDIQLTVKALDNEVESALNRIGYTRYRHVFDHCPPGMEGSHGDWEKWLFKPPVGQRSTNLHVRVIGKPNQRYPLLFRDYLKAHPATARAYAELKKRLAENLADGNTYPDVKDPAVDLIYFAAEEWAKIINWSPGTSDA